MAKPLTLTLLFGALVCQTCATGLWEPCGDAFACDPGLECVRVDESFSTCRPAGPVESVLLLGEWQQCGGVDYAGPTKCAPGLTCVVSNEQYSQCENERWASTSTTTTTTTTTTSETGSHEAAAETTLIVKTDPTLETTTLENASESLGGEKTVEVTSEETTTETTWSDGSNETVTASTTLTSTKQSSTEAVETNMSSKPSSSSLPKPTSTRPIPFLKQGQKCDRRGQKGHALCEPGLVCMAKTKRLFTCQPMNQAPKPVRLNQPAEAPTTTITTTTTTTEPNREEEEDGSYLVPNLGQCGGANYKGSTTCEPGLACMWVDEWFSRCQSYGAGSGSDQAELMEGQTCGGYGYIGPTTCGFGLVCVSYNEWISQCEVAAYTQPASPGAYSAAPVTWYQPPSTTTLSTTTTPSGPLRKNQKCGGKGWTNTAECEPGLKCVFVSQWLSRCEIPRKKKPARTTTKTSTLTTFGTTASSGKPFLSTTTSEETTTTSIPSSTTTTTIETTTTTANRTSTSGVNLTTLYPITSPGL